MGLCQEHMPYEKARYVLMKKRGDLRHGIVCIYDHRNTSNSETQMQNQVNQSD